MIPRKGFLPGSPLHDSKSSVWNLINIPSPNFEIYRATLLDASLSNQARHTLPVLDAIPRASIQALELPTELIASMCSSLSHQPVPLLLLVKESRTALS